MANSLHRANLAIYRMEDLYLCFGSQWAMLQNAVVHNTSLNIQQHTNDVCDASGFTATRIIMQPMYEFEIVGLATGMQWIKNPPSITDGMTVRELLKAVNSKLEKREET